MFLAFFSAVMPVFLIAALGGYLSKKTDWLNNPSLPQLVLNIGLPALLFYSLLRHPIELGDMLQLVLATLLVLVFAAAITFVVLKVCGVEPRFYISVLVNPNTGNLGIPLVYALLGEKAMAAAVLISSIVQISHFTLGVGFMSGRCSWREFLGNAPMLALIVGVLFLIFEIPVPDFMIETSRVLGNVVVPVMLLLLGRSLANLSLGKGINWKRLVVMAIYRPIMGVVVAFVVVSLMGLNPQDAHVLMMQAAMPVAVFSYILVTRYEGPVDDVAGLILLTLPTSFFAVAVLSYLFGV